ncbi:MAG: LysM peptidoglycan-binding domain-containing protein [Deltaproteobacteria bacterium]|nr:LysM peptidoglycan-binding domain-containing protein [Deltaproteobacteria bacterium]
MLPLTTFEKASPPEKVTVTETPAPEKKVQVKSVPEGKIVTSEVIYKEQKGAFSQTADVDKPRINETPSFPEKEGTGPAGQNVIHTQTDQELIDTALDYCQASNDFWEQGDLDNAIAALDKAYSLTLMVNGDNNLEVMQQREDLRFTISKRIIAVYSSRFTVANGSHKAIPLEMNNHVKKALDLFKGREKKFFLTAYARSGKYRPAIIRSLKEAGLPEELSWLPLIESGFKVKALSSARALGMWQFIASTGYKFGLKRDHWIDERMDPKKSTNAAIAYLTELHHIFGDWTTVLAAYNCGEHRVLRHIRNQKINYLDNFWDLYRKLPRETAFYVPKFLAVLHILNDPKAHGMDLPPLEKELNFEHVTINKQVHLKTIAKRIETDYGILKNLNPELRQNLTPKKPYSLKVPSGKGELLLAKLGDIPAWRPPVPAYVVHRVRSGESLSVIANRYKTSIRAIMDMNGLKSKNFLKVGWKLKIPTRKGYASSVKSSASYASGSKGKHNEYVVRNGDSLWKIANRYKTTVNAIRSLNRLQSSGLQIGQVLTIPPGQSISKPGKTKKYRVAKGDSPYLIAKRNRMNLYDFLRLNNLTPKSTIFPGQVMLVAVK